jgi:ring-1,2-phenylacetyl-CoA epoxidase subunit PaaB
MFLTSLDPRINRLEIPEYWLDLPEKPRLDQLITFEVFVQKRENIPLAYVGPVHAPDLEVAFLFAKEQYSRRASCFGLWVVKTQDIYLTPYTDDNASVWEILPGGTQETEAAPTLNFEIFTLKKRGKAHTHAGTVKASDYETALARAKTQFSNLLPSVNVWVVPENKILKSTETDKEMWDTLPEKKYREPVAYKVLDKINAYKNQTSG